MKKIIALLITVILIASLCALTAFAADEETSNDVYYTVGTTDGGTVSNTEITDYNTMGSLFSIFENEYGDVIGGYSAYTTGFDPSTPDILPGEHIKLHIVEGTSEAVINELRELCGDIITEFVTCKYSFNSLKGIMLNINNLMKDNKDGIVYGGIERDGNDFIVSVGILDEYFDATSDKLKAEYGNMVRTSVSLPAIPTIGNPETVITTGVDKANSINPFVIVAIAAVLLLAGTATVVSVCARSRKLALSNGDTVASDSSISVKEVENKVAESAKAPSEHVYDDIMKNL